LKWFSPLVPSGIVDWVRSRPEAGYTAQQISDIVSPLWFHGFISADVAKKMLSSKPEGTFLFRFSSTAQCYGLSVSHLGDVTHWRITTEKLGDQVAPVFKIDNNSYGSLQEIVQRHKTGPLKVFHLLNTGEGKEDVLLSVGLPRVEAQVYANLEM